MFAFNTLDVLKNVDERIKESATESEVTKTLLIHECKSSSVPRHAPPLAKIRLHDSESDTSESEEELKAEVAKAPDSGLENEEEPGSLTPTVMVAGQPHLYSDVGENPELVSFMTDEEREVYIKVGQEMFQSVFE